MIQLSFQQTHWGLSAHLCFDDSINLQSGTGGRLLGTRIPTETMMNYCEFDA